MKKKTLIIGGSSGNGAEISKLLKKRGDLIINVSRKKNKFANKNILIDLLNKNYLEIIKKNIKKIKIDNLIFSQRYRGHNKDEEINLMIKTSYEIINLLRNNFNKFGSVVIISSTAIKQIADQNEIYYISQAARESLVKYFAIKFNNKSVRFNAIMPSHMLKSENKKFYKKNKKELNLLKKINPLNRVPTSTDTAMLVEFLTSNKSLMINGTSIIIDGGLHLYGQREIVKKFYR